MVELETVSKEQVPSGGLTSMLVEVSVTEESKSEKKIGIDESE